MPSNVKTPLAFTV